jgi:hypothetical protein
MDSRRFNGTTVASRIPWRIGSKRVFPKTDAGRASLTGFMIEMKLDGYKIDITDQMGGRNLVATVIGYL